MNCGGIYLNTNSKDKAVPSMPHCISADERKSVLLTGVCDVDSFDEQTVILITTCGELTVKGEGLRIGKLSTDTGEMSIEGKIDSLIYSDNEPKKSGFFARVFG